MIGRIVAWVAGALVLGVVLAAGLLWWMAREADDQSSISASANDPAGAALADRRKAPDVARLAPQPESFGAGNRITLKDYRANQPVPGGDWRADVVRVEVCAGQQALRGAALPAAFSLGYRLPAGDIEYRNAASALAVVDPPLSTQLTGETLLAGDCRDGWVAFVLGQGRSVDTRRPDHLRFDNRGFGFVPENARAELSWSLREP